MYYQASNSQTDSDLHAHCVSTIHENIEIPFGPSDHEQNRESFVPLNTHIHQHNHKQSAYIDSQCTVTEPHISIQSSSYNESDDIESNSHFEQTYSQTVDTSVHSINTNSFLTFNPDNPHTSTSQSPPIGHESHENGERGQTDDHNRDVDDVENDEPSETCKEVGNISGDG